MMPVARPASGNYSSVLPFLLNEWKTEATEGEWLWRKRMRFLELSEPV